MKPIKRQKRTTRRIKVAGKWRGGRGFPDNSGTATQERTASQKRKAIITSDGLHNEVAAAQYLGLAVSTLQNRRSRGEPPEFERFGGRIFYRLEALDRFRNSDGE